MILDGPWSLPSRYRSINNSFAWAMLMHATASTIPLAPAAPSEPSAQSSTATWKSWLSPRPREMASQQRQRRLRREEREGDENDDEFGNQLTPLHRRQKQRYRSTSFDETGVAFDKPSSSHLLYKEGATKIHPVVDNSLTPVDDQHQTSLLARFLLHLNSLLPEYCHHLASTSEDTIHSITCASKAINVLERGVDALYMTYGSANNHVHNFHEISMGGATSSTPSSPLLSQRTGSSPLMPSKIYNRTVTSPTKDKLLLSPLHPSAAGFAVGGGAMKWNHSIVESEWERFISPFMNLVGAECLYARMEHVLDPERCNNQAPVTVKGGSRSGTTNPERIERKEKTSSSLFDRHVPNTSTSTHLNVHPPQLLPHPAANNDTSKLGSRRLIAIYRQIREDLIIVGEYLCDPVLGARVGDSTPSINNAASSTLSTVAKLPLPPLVSDRTISPTDAMRSRSLTLAPVSSPHSDLYDDPNISKVRSAETNYNERRELAAISFRETMDALISFIDARCVLIRIHAVLCFQQKSLSHCISTTGEVGDGSPTIMNNQISDAGRERRKKWSALAEQCQNVLHPLSTLVTKDDDRCIPKRAVSNIKHEVKCLELVLTSIDRLLECDLFQCVLSIRKLSVLLEQIYHQQSCLPLMYIRSSLPKLLAIMHVFFADASPVQIVPSPSPPIPQSAISHHSNVKKQTSPAAKKTNFVVLINEFLRNISSGLPLAVVVAVLKARQTRDSLPSEDQTSKRVEANNHSGNSRWKTLYVSSSLSNESSGGVSGWPHLAWAQVEELLSKHSSSITTSDPVKYSIESAVSGAGNIRGANLSPNCKEYCHVSSVSDSLCLVVIQGVGSAKWQSSSDYRIHHFLRNTAPQLCMENLLSVDVVIRLKSEIFAIKDSKQLRGSDNLQPISLWSESGWSASQRKEVLNSLGLRRKHSPTIIAPLKSPYVKRQIRKLGRQRQKKSSNRGHFEFFLGPGISHLL